MMTVNPNERITAGEALQSDWMMADDSTLSSNLAGNQAELKTFKGKAKLRQVVQMVRSILADAVLLIVTMTQSHV